MFSNINHLSIKLLFDLLGPVSRKSRELFGPEKLVVKLQSACFEKMIFLHVFNIRKIKRIAKFEGLEPRRCEDIKGIVAPERDPKSFGTFEKQAPGLHHLQFERYVHPHLSKIKFLFYCFECNKVSYLLISQVLTMKSATL